MSKSIYQFWRSGCRNAVHFEYESSDPSGMCYMGAPGWIVKGSSKLLPSGVASAPFCSTSPLANDFTIPRLIEQRSATSSEFKVSRSRRCREWPPTLPKLLHSWTQQKEQTPARTDAPIKRTVRRCRRRRCREGKSNHRHLGIPSLRPHGGQSYQWKALVEGVSGPWLVFSTRVLGPVRLLPVMAAKA